MMLRTYRALLRLLPPEFRDEFGDQMYHVVEEQWNETRERLNGKEKIGFWLRQSRAVLRSAVVYRARDIQRSLRQGGTAPWGILIDDFRSARRSVTRRPWFSVLCIAILSIGIGATTLMFSTVSTVLLRQLPLRDSERLVAIREIQADDSAAVNAWGGREGDVHVSRTTVSAWQREQEVVSLVSYQMDESRFEGEDPVVVRGANVSPNFFEFLAEPLLIGRSPTPEESEEDAPRTVILGYSVWRDQFGMDPRVLGNTLTIAGRTADERVDHTIIGVAREGFDFPEGAAIWKTRRSQPDTPALIRQKTDRVIGRLQPGISHEQGETELSRIASSLPNNQGWAAQIRPLRDVLTEPLRPALLLLSGAVMLVLIIACANVGNLLLAQGIARREEFAVRTSIGGSHGRIVRTLMLEGLLLGLSAGVLGIVIAFMGASALSGRLEVGLLPGFFEIGVDTRAIIFAILISLTTGVLAASAPALQARETAMPTLKSASRQVHGGSGQVRTGLMVSEVAVSVVLLAGSAVLLRSLLAVLSVDPGFQSEHVTAFEVRMSGAMSRDNVRRWYFPEELATHVGSLPAVIAASTTRNLPMSGTVEPNGIIVEARESEPTTTPAQTTAVAPGYFDVMGIAISRGRDFERSDAVGRVAVVNETFVKTFLPEEDPLGRRIARSFGGSNFLEIVGVVRDTRQSSLVEAPAPMLYLQSSGDGSPRFYLVVRSRESLASLVPLIREAAREVDPALLVPVVIPLADVVAQSAARPRFYAVSVSSFSALALGLTLFGLYAVLSQVVVQRRSEVAIRVTLGATPHRVLGLFLWQGLRLALLGVMIGLGVAVFTTRLLGSLLFGIRPLDVTSFVGAAFLLIVAATLAVLLPAYRAARTEPVRSLRGSNGNAT